MIETSIIQSNEIEDRIDAPFYQERYLEPVRKFKQKGIAVGNLGDCLSSVTNGVEIRKYIRQGTPYLRVSDMKSMSVSLSAVKYVKETIGELSKKIRLTPTDVLISRSGTPGITTTVSNDILNSIISSHIMRITTEHNKLDPFFLSVYLNSLPGRLQINRITNGCLVTEISHGALEVIKVPLLEISEQKRIAELVKAGDSANCRATNKINEAKKIFEKTLNINYETIKEEKIYSINSNELGDALTPRFYYPKYINTLKKLKENFKTFKLGEADIKRGVEVGSNNYHSYIDKKISDIPFIRTSDLINYEVDNYPDYFIDEAIYSKTNQDLKAGDIIYTKDGKIGLPAMVTKEDKFILASGLARIRVTRIDPHYVFLVLATNIGYYQALQRVVVAATLPHLQQDRLGEIEIPLLGARVENAISDLVKDAFELKAEKKKLYREALEQIEILLK